MADSTTQSQGTSSSSGSSSSLPIAVQSPQSQFGLQLAQMLQALTNNQYNWAMQQFNNGMGVTDQNINQYLQLAGQGAGLAQNLLGRYQNVFEPLMNQYIQQAGTYNSEARQRFMMGQAESTAGQADQAAIDAAQRQLQGFGINPNSGRYQDLLLTSRMQDAATRAGAGTQASVNTANIGRQMTQQAAQMGQNIPGMTVNALNSAYTGLGGAENAILGQLNTGANLLNTVPNFANAAANANRLPPVGQLSSSQQSSGSQNSSQGKSNKQDPNQQGQKAPGGQQGPNQGAGAGAGAGGLSAADQLARQGALPKDQQDNSGDYATAGGLALGNTNPNNLPAWLNNPSLTPLSGTPNDPLMNETAPGNTNWPAPSMDQQVPMGFGQGAGTSQTGVFSNTDQFTPGSFPQQQDQSQQWQGGSYGADQNLGSGVDNSSGNMFQDQSPGGGNYSSNDLAVQAGINDIGSNLGQYQSQDTGGQYTPSQDTGGGYTPSPDFSGGQYASNDFSGGGGDYSGGYAKGGVIPNQTSGGFVPNSASPSGGQQTDDIPARLNAKEFVIPRDVTEHLGTKHFSDLIAKSRKARTGMAGPPPKGKMKPALRMKPTFTSHYMGAQ